MLTIARVYSLFDRISIFKLTESNCKISSCKLVTLNTQWLEYQ